MLEGNRVDCLLVGQTPPPFHGQAIVTGMLFDHAWSKVEVSLLRMAYSDSIESVGRFSLQKVFHLFYLVYRTWVSALGERPRVLYYLPASPNKVPVLRDVIYLSMTRWLFPKLVFHYHAGGLAEYIDQSGWLKPLARLVYSGADVGIELSENDFAPSDYFKAKRKVVIPNGLDVPVLHQKKKISNGRLEVLYVGALVEGKGISNIVKTAALMREAGASVHFNVVGDWGDEVYKQQVLGEIEASGLGGMITFAGVLTGDAKWEAFARVNCFFFPTHYASESFPLVLIEAMACGLPIVTTHWRGIPKLVEGSDAAVLCGIKSPQEYAESLLKFIADEALCSQMAINAEQFYEKNYTKQVFLERMERVLAETAASS
ncbi:D-inositol-3-phosphate glycosyltransferase [Rubritalea halochordaticola]|uniref:D-inositol-3-phosphate glycosyltransferase n=1 Tax=Rubritalea halochordaticola TaxID=714537 RepID=A0ABP9V1U8_9BACT